MRAFVAIEKRIWLVGLSLGPALLAAPALLSAQSLTSGSLRGTVQSADGTPVSGAAVTIESRGGVAIASLTSSRDGEFLAQLLTPGEYRILIEQIGYQPVRVTGVVVSAGSTTGVSITLERKPPPISSVTEVASAGARAGGAGGVLVSGTTLSAFDRPSDLTGIARVAPVVIAPGDGRAGLGIGASGLEISHTRLFVDGVMETLLRHPGVRGEPPSTPIFSRDGLNQVQFLGPVSDLEWRAGPGSLISAQSRTGGGRLAIAPYATFSTGKLGQNKLDNPGDSVANSFQLGAVLSGSIVPDTAHIFIEGAYQSLQQPTAAPWAGDSTRFNGQPGSLRELIPTLGANNFQTDLGRFAAPTVRSWKGGHGQARLDWQIGGRNRVQVRLGFATWKETNPQLGADLFAGTASTLTARDISGAAAITTSGAVLANEARIGFNMARRDWQTTAFAGTVLSGEGIAFGTAATLPAAFDVKRVDLSDALQLSAGSHLLKVGVSVNLTNYQQNYRYGSRGVFTFGDIDRFAAAAGDFFQVIGPTETATFTLSSPGLFLEDTWSASPEFQVQLGVRADIQGIPQNKIAADTAWLSSSGIPNDSVPKSGKTISPRGGFIWNVQNRGEWIVRGNAGLYRGELDPAVFAEAILFDGAAGVKRGQGQLTSWPAVPDVVTAPEVGKRLTILSPNYRIPRTAKFEAGIARGIRGGTTLAVSGSYGHTDYLLRRADLNRAAAGNRRTQEGRPVFGTLVQQGGLVSSAPTTNRQFPGFDLVSGLAPTGYVDHYELTASVEHQAARGLTLNASYTYGKTTDNLVGLLQPDPADQLDPFAGGLLPGGGDWGVGRSDLDVTHRAAASTQYRSGGRTPIGVGVRWRWRSGLPFTPGFRPGVDLNADGGGNNDPAFVDQEVEATLNAARCSVVSGSFATRNSCREPNAQALDVRLSVGLPVRISSGGALSFTVDAFNLVSSSTGVVDRAAVLIDPARTITPGSGGSVTVPFVLNSHFGSLLSRRVDPRLIRFGLRMEY